MLEALEARGHATDRVVHTPQTTRTAADAAAALGVEQGQIVKSLVFRGRSSGQGVLVLVGGEDRVDLARLAEVAGEPVERPDADWVRERTGFAIGGIPPLGHATSLRTLVDERLARLDEVWAAAGTPNAVFPTSGAGLAALTGGRVVAVAAS